MFFKTAIAKIQNDIIHQVAPGRQHLYRNSLCFFFFLRVQSFSCLLATSLCFSCLLAFSPPICVLIMVLLVHPDFLCPVRLNSCHNSPICSIVDTRNSLLQLRHTSSSTRLPFVLAFINFSNLILTFKLV